MKKEHMFIVRFEGAPDIKMNTTAEKLVRVLKEFTNRYDKVSLDIIFDDEDAYNEYIEEFNKYEWNNCNYYSYFMESEYENI